MVKVKYDSDFEFVLEHCSKRRSIFEWIVHSFCRWWYVRGLECTSCQEYCEDKKILSKRILR